MRNFIFAFVIFALAVASTFAQATKTYNNREKTEIDGGVSLLSRNSSKLLAGGIVGGSYFLKNKSVAVRVEGSWEQSAKARTITTLGGLEYKLRKGKYQPFAVALAGMTNESPNSRPCKLQCQPDLGLGVDLGGGLDVPITKNLAVRGRFDELISRIAIGGDIPLRYSSRVSVGLVLNLKK